MRDRNNFVRVLLLGLCAAGLGAPINSAFAQRVFRMSPPPSAPKSTVKPTGTWRPKTIAYVKASNPYKYHQFGAAVALSGDGNTLAVSALNEDSTARAINGNQADHSAINAGAVYVYTRMGDSWKQQAYVKASNTHKSYQFGYSLSLSYDGNAMAVGSIGESSSATGINSNQADDSIEGAGAVYVFTRNNSAWSQQAYVKASNTGAVDGTGYQFGFSVSLSSDAKTLAVGSPAEPSAALRINGNQKDASAEQAGAVYIFTRDGSTWSQQAYVKPWNTINVNGLFGYAVGLSGNGDTLAVGAQNEDGGRGSAYAFTRKNGTWAQETRFAPPNIELGDQLGCSVAINDDGNTIMAGSCEEDAFLSGIQPPDAGIGDRDADSSTGAAYIFVRKDGKWSQQAYMKAFNTRIDDQFGWALAISRDGNTVAIGSHLEDSGAKGIDGNMADFSMEDAGAVYIYTRSGETWSPAAYVKATNTQPSAEFGLAVALNVDGKVLAVGAKMENGAAKGVNGNQADQSITNAGAAYVYY